MPEAMHPADSPFRSLAVGFVGAAVVFLTLDAAWLTAMAERLYRPSIGHLMREGFDVVAAAAFYVLYLAGVVFFAVLPSRQVRHALLRGAFFGLVAYATYDLTNQATLRDWPWHVTFIDLVWGSFVTASAAAGGRLALRFFVR